MKVYVYEGKNVEEVKQKALVELQRQEEEVITKITEEEVGLFKTKRYKLEILVKDEILKYLKGFLLDIVSKMGITANVEAKIRDNHFKFSLYSDNNAILIGKAGRTIESLQTILRSAISNQTHFSISVTLDVEDYKEKQANRIEMLARNTAREVIATGIEVKLDNMNSYERRIVHEEVSKLEGVHTISEGEEPNRYVIIRLNDK